MVRLIVVSALGFVLACTGGSSEPVKTPEAGTTATAATTEAPAGGRVAANSPNAGKDERAGTVRAFAGDDPGKTVGIPGKYAWSLGAGESWTIGFYEFVRADGTKNVFKGPNGEPDFAIPGAYTLPALPPKSVKKGAPVMVPVEGDTTCGRVVNVTEKAIEVAAIIEGKKETKSYEPERVLLLDGKPSFGAPVAYKQKPDDKTFALGWLVYQDGKTAWLVGATRVEMAQVRPIDVMKEYKNGDKVWFTPQGIPDAFLQGTISKVLDDGLFYEIKGADGKAKTAELCSVTSALP